MSIPTDVVLVLDVGTSSSRAALVDRAGDIRALAARANSLAPQPDGTSDLDGRALWELLADATRDVIIDAASRALTPVAVSATSVRGAFVLLDADDRPIWGCGSIDGRADVDVARLTPEEPAFHAATGQRLTFAAIPRLYWLARQRPDLWRQAHSLLTLDAWLLLCLAGTRVMPVPSAAPTGLLALGHADWLAPDADTSWRPTTAMSRLLPELAASGVRVGGVNEVAAARTGLPVGLPVVAGGGDAQIATVGLDSITGGDTAVVMGSHWQAMITLDEARHDPRARFRVIHGPVAGTWQADAIAMGAGLALERHVQEQAGAAGHAATDRWRQVVQDGCGQVDRNLSLMQRAFGVPAIDTPIRVGGGVSRSDEACQILASTLGRPVERGASHQSSLMGTAVCAGTAAAWYPDIATGAGLMGAPAARFEPG